MFTSFLCEHAHKFGHDKMSLPIVSQTQNDTDSDHLGTEINCVSFVSQTQGEDDIDIAVDDNTDSNKQECNESSESSGKGRGGNQLFLKWNKKSIGKKIKVKTHYCSPKNDNKRNKKTSKLIYDTRTMDGEKKELYQAVNSGNIEDMLSMLRGKKTPK